MRALGFLALASCGRLAFDHDDADGLAPCATATGNDEDRDAIDDGCDVCPHVVDPAQLDGDGDGVGDACDPHPTEARDRFTFFDPFTSTRPEWIFNLGMPTIANGSLSMDTRSGAFDMALVGAPSQDVIAIGGHVGAGSANLRQIFIAASTSGLELYYCELLSYTTGGPMYLDAVHTFDLMDYTLNARIDVQPPFENGDFTLELRHDPPSYGCATTWPAQMQELAAPIPSITPMYRSLLVQGLDARIDYVIQIQEHEAFDTEFRRGPRPILEARRPIGAVRLETRSSVVVPIVRVGFLARRARRVR